VQLRNYNTNDNSIFPFLPAICRLSRSTREEAIHVFLRGSTFMVSSYHNNMYFSALLQATDTYRSVRGLHFENFQYFNRRRYPATTTTTTTTTNIDLELAAQCTGLKHITLRMRIGQLVTLTDRHQNEYVPIPVQSLWDRYVLDRLIACNGITKVTIMRKGAFTDSSDQAIAALVAKIETEFKAVGRTVVAVDFKYYDW